MAWLDDDRDGLLEWGGPDIGGRTARLDAAMAEAERRHRAGAHRRPYRADGNLDGREAERILVVEFRPLWEEE